jgi:hypothetical protein
MTNTITQIRKNIMGTISITAKFNGMRKAQEFIIYPIKAGDDATTLLLQSDTRIGRINLITGAVLMSPPRAGGSYGVHLAFASIIDTLNTEDLAGLKFRLVQTASPMAGSSVVYCDNSGADNVAIFEKVGA